MNTKAAKGWRTDFENAPKDDTALVYQPAVKYEGGAAFDYYLTEAYAVGDGEWYSEACNTVLRPTHWMLMPKPPNTVVIQSPVSGPSRGGFCDWSSAAEIADVETTTAPKRPEELPK